MGLLSNDLVGPLYLPILALPSEALADWLNLYLLKLNKLHFNVIGNRPLSSGPVSPASWEYSPGGTGGGARLSCSHLAPSDSCLLAPPWSWLSSGHPSLLCRLSPTSRIKIHNYVVMLMKTTSSWPASPAVCSSRASCFVKCSPHSHQHWTTTWNKIHTTWLYYWRSFIVSFPIVQLNKVQKYYLQTSRVQDRQEIGKFLQTNNVLTCAPNISVPTTFQKNWPAKGHGWSS